MNIFVKGEGVEYYTPNQIILNIDFVKKGPKYEEVLNEGIESVKTFIEQILIPNSIDKEELKTRSFTIEEGIFNSSLEHH